MGIDSKVKNCVNFTDGEFLKFYRNTTKKLVKAKSKSIRTTPELRAAINAIFKAIADGLVEGVGGVYLKRIGYFGVWRSAKPLVVNRNYSTIQMNMHTQGYQYFLGYFPDVSKNRVLHQLTMDRKFSKPLKKRLAANLRKGYKYKNLYHILLDSKKENILF